MMRNRFLVFGCAGALALAGIGCGKDGRIASIVNGQVITHRQLEARMDSLTPTARAVLGNDKARLLEQMIMETVLLQEARRRRLHRDGEVRDLVEAAKHQILISRLLDLLGQEAAPQQVTDQELATFYQANPGQFQEPETFRASHILVSNEETARQAMERVKKGESFAQVAQELSEDPSRAQGGDVGAFTTGQIIPEFEEACRLLKPGEVSGVVKTSLGYHVILLTEHRSERKLPLEEVSDKIRQQLAAQYRQRHLQEKIRALRAEAQIQIRDPELTARVASSASAPSVPSAPEAETPQPANP